MSDCNFGDVELRRTLIAVLNENVIAFGETVFSVGGNGFDRAVILEIKDLREGQDVGTAASGQCEIVAAQFDCEIDIFAQVIVVIDTTGQSKNGDTNTQ